MSPSAADRNLLFGVLALQMDFVGRDALLAAMQAWVFDKAKPLGEILLAQGALGAEEHVLLEALVCKHLERHDNDAARSLAAAGAPATVREALEPLADAELRASLAHLSTPRGRAEVPATPVPSAGPSTGEDPHATQPPSAGTPTSAGLRFRILRPHARGGLGQVYVARDEELNREVALKEIRGGQADDPVSRARFLLEAEVTGRLEHPGIVPVYGLGTYPDGRPFYAMRFVEGESLHETIERFHGRGVPGGQALALHQLLRRFLDVCNAVAYAHSRGILHRDLKPANVMLGPYGETLVVDWGLAKVLSQQGGETTADRPLRPASTPEFAPTQAGVVVGTPQYMSPEQAEGRLDELGPASDVYALGATLYHLLTGRPPFEGEDTGEVLRRVRRGDFRPPRAVNRRVAPALEAVCLRAMALRPGDRYPSPRALAEDLEHWLADEPVSAHRESWGQRLARWSRRHRSWVRAGTAALLTVTAVSVAALLLVGHSRDLELAARRRAEQQQGRAEEALRESRLLSARLALDRGLGYLQQGDSKQALLWLVRCLELAEGRAPDLEQAARLSLPRALRDDLFRPQAVGTPAATFTAGCISADGRWLLLALAKGDVYLCEYPGGRPVGEPVRAGGSVSKLEFSSDGRFFLAHVVETPQGAERVKLWETRSRRPIAKLEPLAGRLELVLFSRDSARVLTCTRDPDTGAGEARLWSSATGRPEGEVLRFDSPVTAAAFAPDGRLLLTASGREGIRLWEVPTGKPLPLPRTPPGKVLAAVFSPDGKRVHSAHEAAPRRAMTFQVWDAARGQPLGPPAELPAGTTETRLLPDGRSLLAWGPGLPARVVSAVTGMATRVVMPAAHDVEAFEAGPDGRALFLGTGDGRVRIWDLQRQRFAGRPLSFASGLPLLYVSPDGRSLVTRSVSPRLNFLAPSLDLEFWDVTTGRRAGRPHSISGLVATRVFFSADGRQALMGSQPVWGKAQLYRFDARSGERVGTSVTVPGSLLDAAFTKEGWLALALSTGDKQSTVAIWNATTGQQVGTPFSYPGTLSGGFSPDGRRLLLVGEALQGVRREAQLFLWDLPLGRQLPSLPVGAQARHQFSPDGRLALVVSGGTSGGERGEIRVLDAATGVWLGKPLPVRGWVREARFGPDGPAVLVLSGQAAGRQWEVRCWDPVTGEEFGKAQGLEGPVSGVQFRPDGRVVTALAGSPFGLRRFWETSTGRLLAAPDWVSAGFCPGASFSRDGRFLVTVGPGYAQSWELPLPVEGDARRLTCWAECETGMELDRQGTAVPLSAEDLERRRHRLDSLGGPPPR